MQNTTQTLNSLSKQDLKPFKIYRKNRKSENSQLYHCKLPQLCASFCDAMRLLCHLWLCLIIPA